MRGAQRIPLALGRIPMDPVHLAIALAPLALYLLGLGAIHLLGRPVVVSGALDTGFLALGLVGLLIVGPMELAMPDASLLPGIYLWALMLTLYVLGVTLWNLMARPRLVIYHCTPQQVRRGLEQIIARLEPQAALAGDSFVLPQFGVQFHLESYSALANVSLVAIGDRQSHSGWRRLRWELAQTFEGALPAHRFRGYALATAGIAMIVWTLLQLSAMDHLAATRKVNEILRQPPPTDSG